MLIKVCGMQEPENIRQVAATGIDWMGFIFYSRSPRSIDGNKQLLPEDLFSINPHLKRVGVFVNASVEAMMETAGRYKLDYLQLHGNESPDVCHTLQKRGYAIIKAFSIATTDDLSRTADYEGRTAYFLFDTKCNDYGGSGKQFDWSILASYTGATSFLLSGGIAPDSLKALRSFHHPLFAGIDLNSGFEIEPGMKDPEKLDTFIKAIRK